MRRRATVAQMFETFARAGQATGRASQAQALIDKMRTQLQSIARRFEHLPAERRPRVYLEIWHDPVTTVGQSSFLDDVVQHAGGANVAGGIGTHIRRSARNRWSHGIHRSLYFAVAAPRGKASGPPQEVITPAMIQDVYQASVLVEANRLSGRPHVVVTAADRTFGIAPPRR